MNERHTRDPRNHPRYRAHGPRKATFTYQDIAEATGLCLETVVAYASGKRAQYKIDDFQSVAAFLRRHVPKALC